jgi:hypothetical protein
MTQQTGFLVDLSGVTFSDDPKPTWIHALSLGTFSHPIYGDITITPDRVKQFAANVMSKVRGVDPDIDFDHKTKTDEAAGWVKAADARSDGLWLNVEWTANAWQKLKDKAYRYFSAEFVDEWEDPKTKVKHKDVVLGGGLTNRPFLKDLVPINLSEAFSEGNENEGGKTVADDEPKTSTPFVKHFAKLYGLDPDTATEDAVLGAATALSVYQQNQPDPQQQTGGQKVAASEDDGMPDDIKKLAETSPSIAAMYKMMQEQKKQLGEATTELKKANVVRSLSDVKGKDGVVLSTAAQDLAASIIMGQDVEKNLPELLKKFMEGTGSVQLGETVGANAQVPKRFQEKSATVQLDERVTELMKNNKDLDITEAYDRVFNEDPELFAQYRDESTAFRA